MWYWARWARTFPFLSFKKKCSSGCDFKGEVTLHNAVVFDSANYWGNGCIIYWSVESKTEGTHISSLRPSNCQPPKYDVYRPTTNTVCFDRNIISKLLTFLWNIYHNVFIMNKAIKRSKTTHFICLFAFYSVHSQWLMQGYHFWDYV